jgi:hypothetical protein
MTSAPTRGRNTARLSPSVQEVVVVHRSVACPARGLSDDDEDGGQDGGGAEEEGAVLLDLAGLHLARSWPPPSAAVPEPLTTPSMTPWSTLS